MMQKTAGEKCARSAMRKWRRAVALCFSAAVLSLVSCAPVYAALPENAMLDMFHHNGMYYWNPNGDLASSYCGSAAVDCNIIGDTADERLWSGLRHVGFTPEQTAAVMGNIYNEGGHPARQEDAYNIARDKGCTLANGEPYTIWNYGSTHTECMGSIKGGYSTGSSYDGVGVGIVGWTVETRKGPYLELMKQAGLIKYFEGDAYKTYGWAYTDKEFHDLVVEATGSEADYWAMWCIALKHVWNEFHEAEGGKYKPFFEMTSVADMAGYMARVYEVCRDCHEGGAEWHERRVDAEKVYERYKNGEFDAVEKGVGNKADSSLTKVDDGSNVTIIGDAVLAEASAEIKKLLSEVQIETNNIKSFQDGVTVTKDLKDVRKMRDNIIYVLGSNAPNSIKLKDIQAMMDAIGDGHNVYFVTNYDAEDQSAFRNNNAAFTAAAAEYSVTIIDWASVVEDARTEHGDTAYIKSQAKEGASTILPTADGAKLFAEMIYGVFVDKTKPTDNCENIADPGDALSYAQQYIADTNFLYGQNYPMPERLDDNKWPNVLPLTPDNDNATSPLQSSLSTIMGISGKSSGYGGCWGAAYCGQCSALSSWFATMMTEYINSPSGASGNGADVVGYVYAANPSKVTVSSTPSAMSIFSDVSTSSWGHTGIVLGDLGDGTWLTLENNMSGSGGSHCDDTGCHQLGVKKRTFSASGVTFVDVSKGLRLEHLGKRYD